MNDSLSLLFKKERPWANRSGRSLQKPIEPIALIFKKRVTSVICSSFEQIALIKPAIRFWQFCPPFYDAQDQIAPVAVYKRATMSDSFPMLMTKEQRERCALFPQRTVLSLLRLRKTSDLLEKTDEQIPKTDNTIYHPVYLFSLNTIYLYSYLQSYLSVFS